MDKDIYLETDKGMRDAIWEVSAAIKRVSPTVLEGIEDVICEKEKTHVEVMGDAMLSAVDVIGGVEKVRCMDVWVGVFGRC